jgi:hypothetical protein
MAHFGGMIDDDFMTPWNYATREEGLAYDLAGILALPLMVAMFAIPFAWRHDPKRAILSFVGLAILSPPAVAPRGYLHCRCIPIRRCHQRDRRDG